jgi:hypothetical protein
LAAEGVKLVKNLSTLLEKPEKRQQIVNECVDLVEDEVKTKGFIVKSAYKVVKAIKPGTIPKAVDSLLDDFVGKLQPYYEQQQQQEGSTLSSYLGGRASDVAESLLEVTDARADKSSSKTMVKAYKKLRPKGKENVTIAVPKLGALLDRHVGEL